MVNGHPSPMRRHKLKLRPQKHSPLSKPSFIYDGPAATAAAAVVMQHQQHHHHQQQQQQQQQGGIMSSQPPPAQPQMANDSRSNTSSVEPRNDYRSKIQFIKRTLDLDPSAAPAFDPFLDPTIRDLFQQQAEIQAKIAALLPTRYPPNTTIELDMLRHKFKALQSFVDRQRE